MKAIRYLLLLVMVANAHRALPQAVSTMPAQQREESYFLHEVKLIDEFIERFNDDKSSYIREQCRSLYGTDSFVNRNRLIKSLFNKSSGCTDAEQFIKEVTNPQQYISFTDSNWYAEANCVFTVNGKKTDVQLVLHIKTVNGASKWMIAGIGKAALPAVKTQPGNDSATRNFIPTSSHGTNFVVFTRALSTGMHATDYFEPALLARPQGQQLVAAIKQGKAKFQYVKGVRYYFFQMRGWVFTVEQFKRKDANTGWLVSGLQRAGDTEKAALLNKLLYP